MSRGAQGKGERLSPLKNGLRGRKKGGGGAGRPSKIHTFSRGFVSLFTRGARAASDAAARRAFFPVAGLKEMISGGWIKYTVFCREMKIFCRPPAPRAFRECAGPMTPVASIEK